MQITFLQKIDFGGNSHTIFDFIEDIVHQAFVIFHTNGCANIVFAYINPSALRKGNILQGNIYI